MFNLFFTSCSQRYFSGKDTFFIVFLMSFSVLYPFCISFILRWSFYSHYLTDLILFCSAINTDFLCLFCGQKHKYPSTFSLFANRLAGYISTQQCHPLVLLFRRLNYTKLRSGFLFFVTRWICCCRNGAAFELLANTTIFLFLFHWFFELIIDFN